MVGSYHRTMVKPQYQRRFLPSHAILRSFECAARHQSFTLAAEELHLTQSAISRQVREFEQIIGTDLFRRIGRRVVLTRAGKNLAGELAIDLENIRQTIMRAISVGESGTVIRVATLPAFASRWLIPRLAEFTALHKDIEISFATRLEPFDLEREHFDLAIHFGSKDWPATDMELLCSETMIPVVSPSFKADYNLTSIASLASAPLLHIETRATIWQDFFKQESVPHLTALSGKYFDQFSLVIAGAVAGLGAALVPAYLIERELSEGKLIALGHASITTKNNYYLVTPENTQNEHVFVFTQWMKEGVSQSHIQG